MEVLAVNQSVYLTGLRKVGKNMNKSTLIKKVAAKTALTNQRAEEIVNCLLDEIIETIKTGEKVSISGFGNFEVRERVARDYKNPKTGKNSKIGATRVPAFKAGKVMKNRVQQD